MECWVSPGFPGTSCLQLTHTAQLSCCQRGHRLVFGAASATAAVFSPAWIAQASLLPCLSPQLGCSGQPENKRNKKGSSMPLTQRPSPVFCFRREQKGSVSASRRRENVEVRQSPAPLAEGSACHHGSDFCTVTSALLQGRPRQHRRLSGVQMHPRSFLPSPLPGTALCWPLPHLPLV